MGIRLVMDPVGRSLMVGLKLEGNEVWIELVGRKILYG